MIKTININGSQSIEANSSNGWLLIYKQTFGHDILPDLMPILEAVFSGLAEIMESTEDDFSTRGIIKALNEGALTSALISLNGMELVTLLQVVWALNKNADNTITNNVIEWANGFDTFEWDAIIPQVVQLIANSSATSKNLTRLQETIQTMRTSQ